jgi:predicted helicase
MNFNTLLDIYRKEAQSEREKGARFECLMQLWLRTEPYYASRFSKVWRWDEEFSSIYVFNLRGNQRTRGELSRKESGKIFGSGSRTPIAITILVKKKKHE